MTATSWIEAVSASNVIKNPLFLLAPHNFPTVGCFCGGYFIVVALRMWCSCWKTGGLSPGGVVKHHVLQEELSPGAGSLCCERWIVLSDGMAGHHNKNRVLVLGYALVPLKTMKSVVDMR